MASTDGKRSIFEILPSEIIFHILDLMVASECNGLPSTCWRAVELVNAMLIAENPFLGDESFGWTEKSMTARLIHWERLKRTAEVEMITTCEGYGDADETDL
jgi:hypothetical protein